MEASTIGQYRIVEPLGQGGMGIVFRARHVASERAVALKTVKLPAPRWLDSIRREIQALTRVRHPGVVRIVDHGVHDGRPWYAMDLLEGETLRQFGRRIWSPYQSYEGEPEPISRTEELSGASELRTIDEFAPESHTQWVEGRRAVLSGDVTAAAGELTTILRVMRRLCASLAFMHGEGFINRDLKPENVVLVNGVPVIIDFGLTTYHPGKSGREELEAQSGIAGTVHYMSPEQIRGEFVDARSDLYSVGCILYELVVGRPPFTGAQRAVMMQHLNTAPERPSERVRGVPPALDQLIMKLLEKRSGKRVGYADEVAAELAELSHDAPRLADYPPARSYLYRPGFVGRDALIDELAALRDRASNGSGALVLLGGESGSGKTRVAMELTRGRKPNTRLLTSEAATLASEMETRGAGSPLSALRPLLRAVADECHAGGPAATTRLLGEHRAVLSVYEPLLAHVPADEPLEQPAALAPAASRERVFRALTETIARFSRQRPLFYVIDDLGWVDEVTQAFLGSLDAAFLARTPLLMLCTYRSEDMPASVRALSERPHVHNVELSRLGEGPVRAMVSDMLAVPEPEQDFVEFVTREAEGNPFFVGEYLRAAVSERILYRDQLRTWQVRGHDRERTGATLSLALPRSLRELIDQRLRALGAAAKQVSLAAAVLGREFEFELLREVSNLPDATCIHAVDELVRRHVLEQTEHGALRFVHDKLREETYRGANANTLRELHARAATSLEAALPDGGAAAASWALLGSHFANARMRGPAVHYLALAARHAQESSAHSEALRLFSDAIEHATVLESTSTADAKDWRAELAQLYEGYADLLALLGKRDEARAAYHAAIPRAGGRSATLSRLHRMIGRTYEAQHAHEDALAHYRLASRHVPLADVRRSREVLDEWLQVRIDEMMVHYWRGDVEPMDLLASQVATLVDQGSPPQQARYFSALVRFDLRRYSYRPTEQTVANSEAQVVACRTGGLRADLAGALFEYGFVLVLLRRLVEAEVVFDESLALLRKLGDATQQVRCLSYLTTCARLRGRLEHTLALATETEQAATHAGMREYTAAALANRAWAWLRHDELEQARASAEEAVAIWTEFGLYPFEWMALLPLLALALRGGALADAVHHARRLIAPRQVPLPGDVPAALKQALDAYDRGALADAERLFNRALAELPEGYC